MKLCYQRRDTERLERFLGDFFTFRDDLRVDRDLRVLRVVRDLRDFRELRERRDTRAGSLEKD